MSKVKDFLNGVWVEEVVQVLVNESDLMSCDAREVACKIKEKTFEAVRLAREEEQFKEVSKDGGFLYLTQTELNKRLEGAFDEEHCKSLKAIQDLTNEYSETVKSAKIHAREETELKWANKILEKNKEIYNNAWKRFPNTVSVREKLIEIEEASAFCGLVKKCLENNEV